MFYPNTSEEKDILKQNISLNKFEDFGLNPVILPEEILEMQQIVKQVYVDKNVEEYIVRIVDATRNSAKYGISLGKYIEWGSSPRGSINLYLASKAKALIEGKNFVNPQFVKEIAHDVLRHRIILNYEGMAENIKIDDIITEVLSKVPLS
jgi:MoxR-like ATPase